MMVAIFFFLTNVKTKKTWSGDIVPSLPFCKICNNVPFYVNLCVIYMYYIVYKQEKLI
jgi:hypothetical protein